MSKYPMSVEGLAAIRLFRYDVELTVIPGLGGKIISIRWEDFELLAHNPRKPLRPAVYAAPYSQFDASGFDECFPTIGPCVYPEYPWEGIEMPDHGEVWALPWQANGEQIDNPENAGESGMPVENTEELCMQVNGVRVPYTFHKMIKICAPGIISFDYRLTNHSLYTFKYLWSSHPLFAPQPGMRLCLPPGTRVRVDWSKEGRLGDIWTEHNWPITQDKQGNPVDLSMILPAKAQTVDKLYSTRMGEGWCALYEPSCGRYAAFIFSPQQIPYVGLSINLGGWPVDEPGYYNIGLEPCCGYPDRLDLAIERGEAACIAPEESVEWSMYLNIGTSPNIDALAGRLRQHQTEFYSYC
jgi:hypothetical protein